MRQQLRTVLGLCALAAFVVVVGGAAGCQNKQASETSSSWKGGGKGRIEKTEFGKTKDGEAVQLYTITNKNGAVAKIMTYGGIVTELHVPDKNGQMGDVVLGF